MSKKIDDLRAAATAARAAAAATPDDAELAQKAKDAEAALAEAEAAAAPKGKTKKVRVIADHPGHAINAVLTLPADEAGEAVAAGWADDSPAAVAYAESIAPDEKSEG